MSGTIRIAQPCGCRQETFMGQKRELRCEHGGVFEKPQSKARRGSTLKQGRGFGASPAQQAKVRDRACLVCGRVRHEAFIHAAHLYPRSRAGCKCPDGVVPLCAECHDLYDDPHRTLDLLPALVAHGYQVEMAHAFLEHGASWREMLDLVTGHAWHPIAKAEPVS